MLAFAASTSISWSERLVLIESLCPGSSTFLAFIDISAVSPIIKTDLILKKTDQIRTIFSLKNRLKTDLSHPKKQTFVTKTDVCNKKTDFCVFFISIQ